MWSDISDLQSFRTSSPSPVVHDELLDGKMTFAVSDRVSWLFQCATFVWKCTKSEPAGVPHVLAQT